MLISFSDDLEYRSLKLNRRRSVAVIGVVAFMIAAYVLLSLPIITVQRIEFESQMPSNMADIPLLGPLAIMATNSTGNVDLTLQSFNFSSLDNTTQISGTSGTLQATITPEGANSRVDMNIQLNGVHIKSTTFTGSFGSLTMTGFVIVDPQTNQLVISLVASTSTLDVLRAFLGF